MEGSRLANEAEVLWARESNASMKLKYSCTFKNTKKRGGYLPHVVFPFTLNIPSH